MTSVRRKVLLVFIAFAMFLLASRSAWAVGWDSDDFLVGSGQGFLSRIAVLDHDLTFKGYLETNFVTVGGLDFDASGRLVAVAFGPREVRVYDSSGSTVGGFTRNDDMLGTPGTCMHIWKKRELAMSRRN